MEGRCKRLEAPPEFDVSDEGRNEDEVEGAVSSYLVSDGDITAPGITRFRIHVR
jgi:hypothetical protein